MPFPKVFQRKTTAFAMVFNWSGWRGSNSLPPPWQGGALPDELHPHFCGASGRNRTNDTRIFSPLLYQLSYRGIWGFSSSAWRPGTGSNRRPLAWQASVLTNWTTGPCGGNNRARTCDPLLVRQMLSQLSYAPTSRRHSRDDLYTIHYWFNFVNTFLKIFSTFFD